MTRVVLEAGRKLGPYEVIEPLGVGGMGEVYVAQDSRLERRVAIKVLPAHLREDPKALTRFREEARAIAAISHPNIVAIHDVGVEGDVRFAVTELLEGQNLRQRIREGQIPWRDAAKLAAGIAEGLSAAHRKAVVHRDLKPENIHLTPDGHPKILDFGLAHRDVEALSQSDDTEPQIDPRPGSIQGTVGYMSPEQLRCEVVDRRTDQFSLGCVLFEMIMGVKPFTGDSAIDTMASILTATPARLEELRKLAPPEIVSVILRCLEKDPASRFQRTEELATILRDLHQSGSSPSLTLPSIDKGEEGPVNTLAVLPFVNASDDPNADYLSDGIAETIINTLSKIPRLRVMAGATVARYRGENTDPIAVGQMLGVRAVLTGRLVEIGETLVVKTELIDVRDGTHLWGEQYQRSVEGILDLQNEIAGEISAKLELRLSGREKKRLERHPTLDADAYRLYLKGRYHWSKRTLEGFRKAIDLYEQAIAQDPEFALPWVGIADCNITLATNVPMRPSDTMPKAKAAARRALELDPELAEAYTSLAAVKWWHDWDREEAEGALRKAIDFNPNYAIAHDHLGLILAESKDFDGSRAELYAARELDPLSLIIGTHLALPELFSGKTDAAIAQLEAILELDPGFLPALGWLGIAWEQKGNYDRAIETYGRALAVEDISIIRAGIGHSYAASGSTVDARTTLANLENRAKSRYVSPYDFAVIHAGLGEIDRAFGWLERGFEDHSTWMVFLAVDHRLDVLRDDPRMKSLLDRMTGKA